MEISSTDGKVSLWLFSSFLSLGEESRWEQTLMGCQWCAYMKKQKRDRISPHSPDRSSIGTIEVIFETPCIHIRFLWSTEHCCLRGQGTWTTLKRSLKNN